jgi:hypothetical protein
VFVCFRYLSGCYIYVSPSTEIYSALTCEFPYKTSLLTTAPHSDELTPFQREFVSTAVLACDIDTVNQPGIPEVSFESDTHG